MNERRDGCTFEDAWALWADFEAHWGRTASVGVFRPQTLGNGGKYAARVAVTTTVTRGGKVKDTTRYVQIGGSSGARSLPAALVRAFTELSAVLEEAEIDAVTQAKF